jgi:sulfoxide reductase heme-binding subunit YedZ
MRGRLRRYYLPLGALSLISTALFAAGVDSPYWPYRLSLATAFVGLALFGISLAIGPITLLRRGRLPPVSTDLRRDVGILAAVFSVLHVAFGLFVYGDIRGYFVYPPAQWPRTGTPLRLDDFGATNWLGLVATGVLIVLAVTSGDWALRRYGARRWKLLQRLAYWAFALVVVHGVVYQRLDPHAQTPLVIAFGATVVSVAVLQVTGYLRKG